jgi:hypothetical protein
MQTNVTPFYFFRSVICIGKVEMRLAVVQKDGKMTGGSCIWGSHRDEELAARKNCRNCETLRILQATSPKVQVHSLAQNVRYDNATTGD